MPDEKPAKPPKAIVYQISLMSMDKEDFVICA